MCPNCRSSLVTGHHASCPPCSPILSASPVFLSKIQCHIMSLLCSEPSHGAPIADESLMGLALSSPRFQLLPSFPLSCIGLCCLEPTRHPLRALAPRWQLLPVPCRSGLGGGSRLSYFSCQHTPPHRGHSFPRTLLYLFIRSHVTICILSVLILCLFIICLPSECK